MEAQLPELQNNYDPVAESYAREFYDELGKKPFDRKMLDLFAEKVGNQGRACDLGCGAGQIAAYLHRHGMKICGIDLSAEMVKQAQGLNPEITFQQGDMISLTEIADDSFAGLAAFYSIIHVPRQFVVTALSELNRVLQPNGTLLLTFHIGQTELHLDEWWGQKVSLDFYFFETQEMKDWLSAAGFHLDEVIEREPYPDIEVQTRRAYVFATKVERIFPTTNPTVNLEISS